MTTSIEYAPWPCDNAHDIVVRNSGNRTLGEWFAQIDDVGVGAEIGPDDRQGAYNRWPVYEVGERVGTLFADATGFTYDAVDDNGAAIN